MTDEKPENGGLLRWVNYNAGRIDKLERRLLELEVSGGKMDEVLKNIREDVLEIKDDQKNNRRLMLAGMITAACSAVTFALTVLAGTGKI